VVVVWVLVFTFQNTPNQTPPKTTQTPKIKAYKDSGDTAAGKNERIWIAEMYGYAFGAATANVWHVWGDDFMLYPGYTPSVVPRNIHYGLHYRVDDWCARCCCCCCCCGWFGLAAVWFGGGLACCLRGFGLEPPSFQTPRHGHNIIKTLNDNTNTNTNARSFDKHWYFQFDVHKCPPWPADAARPTAGIFPPPPHPDALKSAKVGSVGLVSSVEC
jgi:hypothetical protein